MPDAGDHGHGALHDHACQKLVVERHEVLVRAAAAHHQHHFGARVHHGAHALNNAGWRLRPLNGHTGKQHASHGKTTAQRAQHVVHRVAARAGYQADGQGKRRNRQLSRRVHKPFGRKLARQVGHLQAQVALAGKRHGEHVEVHAAFRRV